MNEEGRDTLNKALSSGKVQAVGIPWYHESDYAAILRLMKDGDRLPRTYAEWEKRAKQIEQQIVAQGSKAVRVQLKPEAFAAWCAIRNLDVDAQARTMFASEQAARQTGLM